MGFSTKKQYGKSKVTIEDGRYDMMITRAACLRSKNGNSMLGLSFARLDDASQGIDREYVVLKGFGLDKLGDLCRAAGIPGSDDVDGGLDPENQDSTHEWLLGVCLSVEVENQEEEYNGRKQTKARPVKYGPLSEEGSERIGIQGKPELPSDCYEDFDGLDLRGMTEAKKAVAGSSRRKPKSTTRAMDDGFGDDDIPF